MIQTLKSNRLLDAFLWVFLSKKMKVLLTLVQCRKNVSTVEIADA